MMKIRRTVVVVETQQRLTYRSSRAPLAGWCADCGTEVRLVTPEQAAAACGVSTRAVYAWVEARAVHFEETAGGGLLVCQNSLPGGGGRYGRRGAR